MHREYLDNIKSPDMRSILTKLRIDINCTAALEEKMLIGEHVTVDGKN